MKAVYIKDGHCGIVIEYSSNYVCQLRNNPNGKESSLIFSKCTIRRDEITRFLDTSYDRCAELRFDALGTDIDVSDGTDVYMMNKPKTNIISCYRYKDEYCLCGITYDYQDDEYLTDQLKPFNNMLQNDDIKIKPWFVKSDKQKLIINNKGEMIMKTIYIKDSCCGIKICCPDEYNCILINDRKNKESILRLTIVKTNIIKHTYVKTSIFVDICFDSLGTFTDTINNSEYLYTMKNYKTSIKSVHCYSTNNPGINVACDDQDYEYLADLLKTIYAVLYNHGVELSVWFDKSEIVWPRAAKHSTYYNELIKRTTNPTTKERLERDMMEEQKKLLQAKTDAIASSKRVEELYEEAINAMKHYSGNDSDDQDI